MQIGRAYSNNGLSFRSSYGNDLVVGEVFLSSSPTTEQIEAAFPGYDAAVATQQAVSSATSQFSSAIATGLTIAWNTSTSLNGTYALDQTSQFYITSEQVSITANSKFTNGQTTRNWPDASNTYHTFTTPQFTAFATAVALYVDQLITASQLTAAGGSPSWPNSSITIDL